MNLSVTHQFPITHDNRFHRNYCFSRLPSEEGRFSAQGLCGVPEARKAGNSTIFLEGIEARAAEEFCWAHNKLADTKSYLTSMAALQRMSRSPHRYLTSTAIQALHTAFTNLFSNLPALQSIHKANADPDRLFADALRLELRHVITRAWKARGLLFGGPLHKLSCYPDAPIRENGNFLEVEPRDCPRGRECCLKPALIARKADLNAARNAIKIDADRKEVAVRGKILRHLEKHATSLMTRDDCRGFGDAYFIFFCPKDGVVITTNVRDVEPMAKALGVRFEAPV